MWLWAWWIGCVVTPPVVEDGPEDTLPPPQELEDTAPATEPPASAAPPPPLRINEVQAANDSTVMDGAGRFFDWIEIFNASDAPIDLARVAVYPPSLGPEAARSAATWSAGTILAPGAHAWVFCDAGDAGAPQPDGVAPFSLSRDGSTLVLTLDGAEVDRVTWAALPTDAAIARIPDGRDWFVTARPTPGATNGSRPTASADPTDLLFSLNEVPELQIWLSPASIARLDASPYEEVPGAFAIGAAFYPNVGIKLKGRLGSYRSLGGKAGFRVDLNAYEDHGVRGLESLTINNMVQDPSYTHEVLTYTLFRALDVPAPRTGYATVSVNGERYGFYLNVETVDARFLGRWFQDDSGPMWEGSYGADFDGNVGMFEYDEGPPIEDRSPLLELASFLDTHPPGTPNALTDALALVDMDRFLTMMAVEAVALHWDGYTTRNNYHVYHDPSTDLLTFMPWGVDQTWVDAWFGLYDAQGRLFQWCIAQTDCRAAYDLRLRQTARAVINLGLVSQLDALNAWLDPWVALDARAERPWDRAGYAAATRATLENKPVEVLQQVP
jgi:hypothetical protein